MRNRIKEAAAWPRVTRARESGEMISLADDLKAAATDSLKKAAALLGVGLHLYHSDRNPARRPQSSTNSQPTGSNANRNYGRNDRSQGGNGGNGGDRSRGYNNQGNGRISSKQHKYILYIIKDLGMTKSEINQQCVQAYGSVLAHTSRKDASNLIDELKDQKKA